MMGSVLRRMGMLLSGVDAHIRSHISCGFAIAVKLSTAAACTLLTVLFAHANVQLSIVWVPDRTTGVFVEQGGGISVSCTYFVRVQLQTSPDDDTMGARIEYIRLVSDSGEVVEEWNPNVPGDPTIWYLLGPEPDKITTYTLEVRCIWYHDGNPRRASNTISWTYVPLHFSGVGNSPPVVSVIAPVDSLVVQEEVKVTANVRVAGRERANVRFTLRGLTNGTSLVHEGVYNIPGSVSHTFLVTRPGVYYYNVEVRGCSDQSDSIIRYRPDSVNAELISQYTRLRYTLSRDYETTLALVYATNYKRTAAIRAFPGQGSWICLVPQKHYQEQPFGGEIPFVLISRSDEDGADGSNRWSAPAVAFVPAAGVIIDAGHGGGDPGAVAGGLTEAEITGAYAGVLDNQLKNVHLREPLPGRVYATRQTNRSQNAAGRLNSLLSEVNKLGGASNFLRRWRFLVSLHCNSSPADELPPNNRRVEIYYNSTTKDLPLCQNIASEMRSKHDFWNFAFAPGSLPTATIDFRLIQNTSLAILKTPCESALVELGFINSSLDRILLTHPIFRELQCEGIHYGIDARP